VGGAIETVINLSKFDWLYLRPLDYLLLTYNITPLQFFLLIHYFRLFCYCGNKTCCDSSKSEDTVDGHYPPRVHGAQHCAVASLFYEKALIEHKNSCVNCMKNVRKRKESGPKAHIKRRRIKVQYRPKIRSLKTASKKYVTSQISSLVHYDYTLFWQTLFC